MVARCTHIAVAALLLLGSLPAQGAQQARPSSPPGAVADPRLITSGWNIPSEGYADQPYIVKTDDGAWLCVMTTGRGVEGAGGQHVVSMRSTDRGRTWSDIVPIEPADGPEASYAVLLKVPGGRIYVFYNHNTDRVREVRREDRGVYKRVDSLGHYVFKYSDDHGRSWSARRYEVPIREFACDRNNVYGGRLRFFWNVGRPLIRDNAAIMVLHKVGAMGAGFFAQSEGAFFTSKNILTESNPDKLTFQTLPDGDVGLRTPAGGGRVAEEQSLVRLSDGSLYCVYRTVDGWPACAYSRDGGHTWTPPEYASYTPGGRRIKHPRAANFAWNCSNGKFLYWFHNHGGAAVGQMRGDWGQGGGSPYDDRNPAWLAAGREVATPHGRCIEWSQPEILLYDDDPYIRMSYPDMVEDGGKFYVTETQKNVGRVHEIPARLIDGLFDQWSSAVVAQDGLLLSLPGDKRMPQNAPMPRLPQLTERDTRRADYGGKDRRAGFSLDLWLSLDSLKAGQALVDSRGASGAGILVSTANAGALRIALDDGRSQASWESDRGAIQAGKPQHVVIIVDGGPKIITFVVNGVLCDGGQQRQFGWGRFSPNLRTPVGAATFTLDAAVRGLRIYGRALRTSEAVGNFHAGLAVPLSANANLPKPIDCRGPEHRLYVSPSGDDRAEGTERAPFRTLYRAQEAARALAKDMLGDVVVDLAPGDYRLDHTLAFTEADSGRNGYCVIYRSAAGSGRARLLGSLPLKGWQAYRDGIWKIALPPKTVFHTLYENGVRVHKARYPDFQRDPTKPTALGQYLVTVDGTPKQSDKSHVTLQGPGWLAYRPEDAPPVTSVTKMNLHIYPGGKCAWVREIHRVIAIDPQTGPLTFEGTPFHGVGVGARFFLEDELGFLNAPGEFFVDETAHTLYYMPLGKEHPDTLGISYPVLQRMIQIQGKSRTQCVEHLVLDGLAMEESDNWPPRPLWAYDGQHDGALLWMSNTTRVEIRNCHLKNSGRSGIILIGHNTDNLVSGCWIEHAGLNGVSLCNHFLAPGGKTATADRCENNRLYNTHISYVGELHTYAECVSAFNVSNNEVDHCQLDNSVRYAITLRGNTGAQYGPPVSTLFPPTKANRFHHLRIERCGQDGGDMGALHVAGLNNPGGGCVNTFDQITIADTAAIASMQDIPPNGIFLDWPKMAMDQVFRNIQIVRSQGLPFRSHGADNEASAQTENVSWKPGFREERMDYAHIGLTAEFPAAYGGRPAGGTP